MSKLILVRHGQSEWNLANRFTGWWDVGLTEKGVAEAKAAGELLRDGDVTALPPALLTPAYGDVVIAGNDFGLHGGGFFDEYDDE